MDINLITLVTSLAAIAGILVNLNLIRRQYLAFHARRKEVDDKVELILRSHYLLLILHSMVESSSTLSEPFLVRQLEMEYPYLREIGDQFRSRSR